MGIREGLLLADAVFHRRQREQQEFELKKQDLDLRRKILQGDQASRELRDFQTQLTLQQMLRQYGKERQAEQALGAPEAVLPPAAPPAPPALEAPSGTPPTSLAPSPPGTGTPAAMYQRLVSEIGQSEGVAPEVIRHGRALLQPESNFNPDAVSPKGAAGLMQLMGGTAARYGVQDRLNPLENIRGGLRYLSDLYQRYPGRPDLVSAAYNAGEGAVEKAGTAVPPYPETQAYVKKVDANLQAQGPQGQPSPLVRQPSTVPMTPELYALNRELEDVDRRSQEMEALLERRPDLGTTDTFRTLKQRVDALRQRRTELVGERDKLRTELQPQLDKAFDAYFAENHNGQRLAAALQQPGGPQVVQQARAAFDRYEADKKAQEALLREQQTQPLALARAEAGKALTPIPKEVAQTLANQKSIYTSIAKIEAILREGTDLPEDFVNLVSTDAPAIQAALQQDPKNLTGILRQFSTKWGAAASNDPRVNRFLSALANMRDLVIRERSGAAVTGTEMERATGAFLGSLPDLKQSFSLFAQNLANIKDTVVDSLVTMGGTVRPLSGGKAVFEGLPLEVKAQILRYEQQALEREQGQESPPPPSQRLLEKYRK